VRRNLNLVDRLHARHVVDAGIEATLRDDEHTILLGLGIEGLLLLARIRSRQEVLREEIRKGRRDGWREYRTFFMATHSSARESCMVAGRSDKTTSASAISARR